MSSHCYLYGLLPHYQAKQILQPTVCLPSSLSCIWMSTSSDIRGVISVFEPSLCLFGIPAHTFHSPGGLLVYAMLFALSLKSRWVITDHTALSLHTLSLSLSWPWPYKGPEESRTKTWPTHTKMQRRAPLRINSPPVRVSVKGLHGITQKEINKKWYQTCGARGPIFEIL